MVHRLLFAACLLAASLARAQHPVEGVWVLDRIVEESAAPLTPSGTAIMDAYDLLADDPSLRCEPASLAHVWGNPNTRTGIRVTEFGVELSHELFDLRRAPPRAGTAGDGQTYNLDGTAFAAMGTGTHTFDGERLVVETAGHAPGFIRTGTGYPQGQDATAVETFWREGDYLMLELVYHDPALFTGPYRILHRLVSTGENEVPVYNCTDGDYDWFEQLNRQAMEGDN